MSVPRTANLIVLLVPWLVLLAPSAQAAAEGPTYRTYTAYETAVGTASFIGPNTRNPRLLTDEQFAGQIAAETTLLGVYYGNQGWEMGHVRNMESWQRKKFAVVNVNTNWCDTEGDMDRLFDVQLINVWNNRNVPLITWEPNLCSEGQTPADVEVRAAAGAYDAYVATWAGRLKRFLSGPDGVYSSGDDRRVFLRLGHEMNGDWFRWGAAMGNNAPADYVRMWKRVKDIFDAQGMGPTHVQWMWCANHTNNGGYRAEEYYPGDAYVDWIAVDGYNWGETESWSNWSAPDGVFDAMIDRLRVITSRPLAIAEYATTSTTTAGPDVAAKAEWITDIHQYALTQDVRMVVWFNEDKETDWAVFGGARGDSTYVAGSNVQRPDPWPVVGGILLTVFIVAQAVFVLRLR